MFIGGTSGEGPWLTQAMLVELGRTVAKAVNGQMPVTIQVTANSAAQMNDNVDRLADSGVDAVVIAPPFFQMRPTQDYLKKLYLEVIEHSPLPVGLYHRGRFSSVAVDATTLIELASHELVVMLKDSSSDASCRTAFAEFKRQRPGLLLLNGDEFDCCPALEAGYDGMLLGGACFNGPLALKIYELANAGKGEEARQVQQRMNDLMYTVFGGKEINCWLAGQKQILVEMGLFGTNRTIINFQLTPECATAIKTVAADYRRELMPYLNQQRNNQNSASGGINRRKGE